MHKTTIKRHITQKKDIVDKHVPPESIKKYLGQAYAISLPTPLPSPLPQHTYNDTDSQKSKNPPQFKSHLHSANEEKTSFRLR